MGERRTTLADAATDWVLEHGVVGMSLRPLAAAIGTSDRMLLYHFRDKDDLVTAVLEVSTDRSMAQLRELPASSDPRQAVLDLWEVVSRGEQARCQRLYVEAAALGVLGREPYAAVVSRANERWISALADHLAASGVGQPDARRAARLVEATFMGLMLDDPVTEDAVLRASVEDLAHGVGLLWDR